MVPRTPPRRRRLRTAGLPACARDRPGPKRRHRTNVQPRGLRRRRNGRRRAALGPRGGVVERRDAARKAVDDPLDLRAWDEPVDVAILRCEFGGYVVAAEQDLHRPAAPDQASEARHGTATGHRADTDLELRLTGPLSKVTRQYDGETSLTWNCSAALMVMTSSSGDG